MEHERTWDKGPQLRAALEELRPTLVAYADLLGRVAGVRSLIQPRGMPQA